ERKCPELGGHWLDTDTGGSDFILTNGLPRAAEPRIVEPGDHEHAQQPYRDEQVEPLHVISGREGYFAITKQLDCRWLGDLADTTRATGNAGSVGEEIRHNLTETKCHDGQVVASKAQRRRTDQHTKNRRK